MTDWRQFRMCAGCSFDFETGEGERSCDLGECAYMPGELDVWCPQCFFNYFTGEGNPSCEDPESCEHGEEARQHVANVKEWLRQTQPV